MSGSVWVFLVAITLYATTLLVHRMIDSRWSIARLPVSWFYSSWLLGLLLLTLPLFRYYEGFTGVSGAYLIAILMAVSLGSISAAFWARQPRKLDRQVPEADVIAAGGLSSTFLLFLLFSGIIGTCLVLLNSVLGGSVSLLGRFDAENLATVRSETLNEASNSIGIFFGPAHFFSAVGSLGVAYVFYMKGSRSTDIRLFGWIFFLAILGLLVNLIVGFVGFGSRMFSLFSIVVSFVAFLEGRWAIGVPLLARRMTAREATLVLLIAATLVGSLWVAATVFVGARLQQQDARAALYRTHRASLDPMTYELTSASVTSQNFMLSLSYLTTPIPTLVYYLDLPAARYPGPFFGEYNFPAIWRWGRRLTFQSDPFAWPKARYEIFKPLGDIGFGMNVWSTLPRDLIADFGKAGALIFLAVFSFLAQRLFDLHREVPTVRRAGLLVYIRLIFVFSGLVSMLFMANIYWPLYLSVLLVFIASRSKWRVVRFRAIDKDKGVAMGRRIVYR